MTTLRIVPADPDPSEFPPRRYACLDAPATCRYCHVPVCPHGVVLEPLLADEQAAEADDEV